MTDSRFYWKFKEVPIQVSIVVQGASVLNFYKETGIQRSGRLGGRSARRADPTNSGADRCRGGHLHSR